MRSELFKLMSSSVINCYFFKPYLGFMRTLNSFCTSIHFLVYACGRSRNKGCITTNISEVVDMYTGSWSDSILGFIRRIELNCCLIPFRQTQCIRPRCFDFVVCELFRPSWSRSDEIKIKEKLQILFSFFFVVCKLSLSLTPLDLQDEVSRVVFKSLFPWCQISHITRDMCHIDIFWNGISALCTMRKHLYRFGTKLV